MQYFALPFAIYYCHSQESENKVLEVTLEVRMETVEAAAVCHGHIYLESYHSNFLAWSLELLQYAISSLQAIFFGFQYRPPCNFSYFYMFNYYEALNFVV